MCDLNDPGGVEIFHKGEQAGRLAAVRAEVERDLTRPVHGLEACAKRAQHYANMLANLPTQAHPYQVDADRYAGQAADCRRWLEATR